MTQSCKFCGSDMLGEFETLSNSKHYRFLYACPKCKAVYEDERKVQQGKVLIDKSRWFNPNTGKFEE